MGRVRRGDEEVDIRMHDPDRLPEDPADGCPGGDQRCRFVQTLMPFRRRADRQRNRVANPRFDRCTDELVLDAIAYFEAEQDACVGHCDDEHTRKLEEERDRRG